MVRFDVTLELCLSASLQWSLRRIRARCSSPSMTVPVDSQPVAGSTKSCSHRHRNGRTLDILHARATAFAKATLRSCSAKE